MYSPHLANTTNHPFGIAVKTADGIYIIDENNHRYIDLISGIAVSNLGHQHPHIIESLNSQLENTFTLWFLVNTVKLFKIN